MNAAIVNMRDINNKQLPLQSVLRVEPNVEMDLRYDIYLF